MCKNVDANGLKPPKNYKNVDAYCKNVDADYKNVDADYKNVDAKQIKYQYSIILIKIYKNILLYNNKINLKIYKNEKTNKYHNGNISRL